MDHGKIDQILKLDSFRYSEQIICQSPLYKTPQWAMWLESKDFKTEQNGSLRLQPVQTQEDWKRLFRLRARIEYAFGNGEKEVLRMIQNIQRLCSLHNARWYLATEHEKEVGEIGLLIFKSELGLYGRLQDVDILPDFQSRGLGRQLLALICAEAKALELSGLCLRADAQSWPKDWYSRFGFQKLAELAISPSL